MTSGPGRLPTAAAFERHDNRCVEPGTSERTLSMAVVTGCQSKPYVNGARKV